MGFFEQKHPNYGNHDSVGIMRDIRLVTHALSSTDELRHDIESRCIALIEDPTVHNASLRNSIFQAKDEVVAGHIRDVSDFHHADATNLEYHKLFSLREILLANPIATLKALDTSLDNTLKKYEVTSDSIISIDQAVKNTDRKNFREQSESLENKIGHTGLIFFLEGCILAGKCLDAILEVAITRKEGLANQKNSMQYWDFRNVIRLAEARIHLDASEKKHEGGKAFVISGGAGNTLASLGAIRAHLQSGGTIKAISGTSMGGMISVLVGVIGNNLGKLEELMNDIVKGFTFEGKTYTIPEQDLYKPWNARRAKSYIEKLLVKYGIGPTTTFQELTLPVIINAGRQYKNGEQEIVLSGGDSIHDAVLASMNVPIPGLSNYGGIGITKIDEVKMIDYAANERGNPNHWIEAIGIEAKDEVIIDAGYSSESWEESYPADTRKNFLRATQRDFFGKLHTKKSGGIVLNIDPTKTGHASSGGIILSNKTKKLFEQGELLYRKSTFPLSQ